jgi:hypothetical protein
LAVVSGGLPILLAMSTPSFTTMLRFDPEHPDKGDYEIHRLPHGPVEKGRTAKVVEVAANASSLHFATLSRFQFRYAVRTVADGRPWTTLIWLVGLKSCKTVNELEKEATT